MLSTGTSKLATYYIVPYSIFIYFLFDLHIMSRAKRCAFIWLFLYVPVLVFIYSHLRFPQEKSNIHSFKYEKPFYDVFSLSHWVGRKVFGF